MVAIQSKRVFDVLRRCSSITVPPLKFRYIQTVPCSTDTKKINIKQKNTEALQQQRTLIANFLKKGNLDGLEVLKDDVTKAGNIVNNVTFDSHFIAICSEIGAFDVGKEYFKKLRADRKEGLGVIGKFMVMCYTHKDNCSPEDHDLILQIYDELVKKYEVLDVSTCEAMAMGVGMTSRWKTEIQRLFKMVTHSDCTPSPSLWSVAVESALLHNDVQLAWEFMNSYAASGKAMHPPLFETILGRPSQFNHLLSWLARHGVILTKECGEVIERMAPSQGASATFTKVTPKGVCNNCGHTLLSTPLSNEEFTRLRNAFFDSVLVGKNVFLKSWPEEVSSYLQYLDKVLPVDVVIDGLNVAYASNKSGPKGSLLKNMTSHFVAQGGKILVVGRQHMNKWRKEDIAYIKRHASVFLADNLSSDDPFVLFAALRSGLGTKFVSRDRMGAHKFLLRNQELKRIFSKWQGLYQYYPLHITTDGQVIFKTPSTFVRVTQSTLQNIWHVPCVDHSQKDVKGHLQDQTAPWLCIVNNDNINVDSRKVPIPNVSHR